MNAINVFLNSILGMLLFYIGISVLYQFALAISSRFSLHQRKEGVFKRNKFLILMPAYQEDDVVIQSTIKNLKVDYNKEDFDICVISEQLKTATIASLRSLGVEVHIANFDQSTKVKSLRSAMRVVDYKKYNGIVVLDADNVMKLNFLKVASRHLSGGCKIMQCSRKPSNLDNALSVFNAIADEAHAKMFGKGANNLGLSSALSDSAMIFETATFADIIFRQSAIGGFDKEMELELTKSKKFIHYIDKAIVYDEKMSSFRSYSNQRARCLQAQYSFFAKSIWNAIRELSRGNANHFHNVIQLALPPNVLLSVSLVMIMAIAAFTGNIFIVILAVSLIIIDLLTYALLIPMKWVYGYGVSLVKAIPILIAANLHALLLMPKARNIFLFTAHHKALDYER